MRKIITLSLAVALALAACGGEADDPTGTYDMVSIDGNALPYAPAHQGQKGPEIVSGSLTLNADGAFAFSMGYRLPGGATQSNNLKGTYTMEGSECRLKWEGAGTTPGDWEGDTFSFNNEGMVFAFER